MSTKAPDPTQILALPVPNWPAHQGNLAVSGPFNPSSWRVGRCGWASQMPDFAGRLARLLSLAGPQKYVNQTFALPPPQLIYKSENILPSTNITPGVARLPSVLFYPFDSLAVPLCSFSFSITSSFKGTSNFFALTDPSFDPTSNSL